MPTVAYIWFFKENHKITMNVGKMKYAYLNTVYNILNILYYSLKEGTEQGVLFRLFGQMCSVEMRQHSESQNYHVLNLSLSKNL